MERSELIEMMKSSEVDVTFTKVDGTIRNMVATLSEDVIPQQMSTSDSTRYAKNANNVCAVWDVVNNGWRSFRWDTIIEVNGASTKITS